MHPFDFIDLFCGIGGFHAALSKLGGVCVFASDIDPECRQIYYENFGIMPHGDIQQINESAIPSHDVLCAGFPCQAFSKAGKQAGLEDVRGTLFFDIIRIAKYHKPQFLMLENVRNLIGHDNGRTWHVIKEHLTELRYKFPDKPIIFSPHWLGIPQFRERVFILCEKSDSASDKPFVIPQNIPECNPHTIIEENENAKKYRLSETENQVLEQWEIFIQNVRCQNGRLPAFPIWTEEFTTENLQRNVSELPTWKQQIIQHNRSLYQANEIFIKAWLKQSLTISSFFGAKAKFEWQVGDMKSPTIWSNIIQFRPSGVRIKKPTYFPALVAITQTSIVGSLKRKLTPRETARLQSFPDKIKLHKNDRIAYKQLGNSVNVDVIEYFARQLIHKQFRTG